MSRKQWIRYVLAGLLFAFVAVPGRHGPLDGLPLENPLETVALFLALWACVFLPLSFPQEGRNRKRTYVLMAVLLAAIAAKAALGAASLPRGLTGHYASATAPAAATVRLDPVLAFESKGYVRNGSPFPVWFLNDRELFNEAGTDRTLLPFTAVWEGFVEMDAVQPDFALVHDGDASIAVGGTDPEKFVAWKSGPYPVRVTYASPPSRGHFLYLAGPSGAPFTELYPAPYGKNEIARDKTVGFFTAIVLFAGLLAAILLVAGMTAGTRWIAWMKNDGLFAILAMAAFAFAYGTVLHAAQSPYFNTPYAGSDELTYETFARHAATTGDWSMIGLEREAYYYQLYYYFLAAMHALCGEGFASVFALQAMALVFAALVFARTGILASAPQAVQAGVFAAIAFMPELVGESGRIMPTVLGVFFAGCAAALMMRKKGHAGTHALAGAMLGLGILNRYNFLAWVPFVLAYALVSAGKGKIVRCACLTGGIAAVLAPFFIRNGLIAHQWRLVSQSNTTANFMLGTPVPENFVPQGTFRAETFPFVRTVFDERASAAIEWMREQPWDYLALMLGKAEKAVSLHPALWCAFAIVSVLWTICPRALAEGLERRKYLVYGGFAISQMAVITLFSTGNDRYYFVITPFLVTSAGMLAAAAYRSKNSLFQSSKQSMSQIRWPWRA